MEPQQNQTDLHKNPSGRFTPNRCRIALAVLLLVHAAFMAFLYEPVSTGADANGYLVQAQLLVNRGTTTYQTDVPLQFTGPHWLQLEDGHIVSRYPPGLALLLAPLYWLGGAPLMLTLNFLLTTLSLAALYGLCALWIAEPWALFVTVVMAFNPVANSWAMQADSHPAIAFFLICGLLFLALWLKQNRPAWAFLAGLCLGFIPTLHYAETIFGAAIAVYLLLQWKYEKQTIAGIALAAAGALIPVVLLAVYNLKVLGSIASTGYTLSDDTHLFGLRYFQQKALFYPLLLTSAGVGPFAITGCIGTVYLIKHSSTRKEGILIAGLIVPLTLLYTAYFFQDQTLRFLLPTFFLYILATAWALKLISKRYPRAVAVIASLLIIANVAAGAGQSYFISMTQKHSNSQLAKIVHTVESSIEPDSIVIAPMIINQQLDAVGKWRLADESYFIGGFAGPGMMPSPPGDGMGGPPLGPPPGQGPGQPPRGPGMQPDGMEGLFQSELKEKTVERYRSQDGELSEDLLNDLDHWAVSGRNIYWLGEKQTILNSIPSQDDPTIVAKLEIEKSDIPSPHSNERLHQPPPSSGGIGGPPPHGESGPFGGPPSLVPGGGPAGGPGGPGGGPGAGPMGALPGQISGDDVVIVKWIRN